MNDRILITGATGNVGSEVVRQLAAGGVPVRAMIRNRAKAASIDLPGVEIVEGDFEKPATLATALEGVARALLVSTTNPRLVELESNFIDAAGRAGRAHVVKVSSVAVVPDSPASFFRWHAGSERHLIESGLPYTILQPNFFMQNIFSFAATIAKEGKFYGAARDGKIAMIDIRDIAAVAVKILTGRGHESRTYVITGAEALSLAETAARLSTVLGRPVSYVDIPSEALRGALLSAGMPEWQASGYIALHELLAQGAAAEVTDGVKKIAGKEPNPFEKFARDFRAVFDSAATARS